MIISDMTWALTTLLLGKKKLARIDPMVSEYEKKKKKDRPKGLRI